MLICSTYLFEFLFCTGSLVHVWMILASEFAVRGLDLLQACVSAEIESGIVIRRTGLCPDYTIAATTALCTAIDMAVIEAKKTRARGGTRGEEAVDESWKCVGLKMSSGI